MTDLSIDSFFATPIASAGLGDPVLLGELKDAIWMLEDGDEAGARWCVENGYDGYTSYASLDDLPRRASAFADLERALDQMAAGFAERLHWDLTAHKLRLDSLWVNIFWARAGAIRAISIRAVSFPVRSTSICQKGRAP